MSTSSILSYLQDLPAQAPPPGKIANLAHPESKGYILIVVSSVLFFFMMLCFFARMCYPRTSRETPMGRNDWGRNKQRLYNRNNPLPSPPLISPLTNHPTSTPQAVAFLSNALVSPTLLTKLTLFLLYLDLFRPFKWLRICVYIGICITVLFYSTIGIMMIVWSSPHAGETWQTHLFTMEQQYAQIYASPWSAVGLGIDLFLLGLPLKAVGELCLPWRRKLVVGIVFLTGILWVFFL
ncbi:hypothetical protein BCON_0599g00030 [Botryotinia convoluta]|uniref:Rhodopsin domain-containing protein n=1 Tax=Botryotinia convoluta TaxID=54673 RepID=A0A4Z1H9H4_9HELO|nr:hypothetical protein BCON_0599g00030 [Botryotinia convoluta]